MNRNLIFIASVVFLLVFAIVHHIWADWGLITIHAKQEPLGKVIASMERQGHARIETDIAGDTPVTMDVVKVHLTDALETLSVNTESRWRLLFFVAGDKATLKTAETTWFGGQKPDGWRMVSFGMGGNMFALGADDDSAPPDPREDVWTPRLAAPAPVQNFFLEAAQLTNAGFAFPETWNPTVKSAPPTGTVDRVVPKLVSAAGGREDQVFFLSKAGRRGPRNADRGDGLTLGDDFRPDPDLLAARVQSQINRLPPDQRGEAQSNFDSWQAFRKSLEGMTDDQRRAAFQQRMQDPNIQAQMANRMDQSDARMSHDQRMSHFQNYVNRKLTAQGKL